MASRCRSGAHFRSWALPPPSRFDLAGRLGKFRRTPSNGLASRMDLAHRRPDHTDAEGRVVHDTGPPAKVFDEAVTGPSRARRSRSGIRRGARVSGVVEGTAVGTVRNVHPTATGSRPTSWSRTRRPSGHRGGRTVETSAGYVAAIESVGERGRRAVRCRVMPESAATTWPRPSGTRGAVGPAARRCGPQVIETRRSAWRSDSMKRDDEANGQGRRLRSSRPVPESHLSAVESAASSLRALRRGESVPTPAEAKAAKLGTELRRRRPTRRTSTSARSSTRAWR